MYKPSNRLENLPPYIFSSLGSHIRSFAAAGNDIIRLDIGSPDGMPPPNVIDALTNSARQPHTHGYSSYNGIPEFRRAVSHYYAQRFGVSLNPDTQVLPLLGSKEGLVNLCLAYLNEGDTVLVPDIAYPAYSRGAMLAGAVVQWLPLIDENQFLPDVKAIPLDVAKRAKLMWINYPNNPTGAVADKDFYQSVVDYCREHQILLASDNPYFDLTFDGFRAGSVLEAEGANECCIEFMSFSKTYNMGGWRLGAAVGNSEVLKLLLQMKSNLDTGHFVAIYQAGIAALEYTSEAWAVERNQNYERRRDMIMDTLPHIGLSAQKPYASMYVWAKANDGNGQGYAQSALENTFVSVTPGYAFGPGGEQYVRFSLGITDDRLDVALRRLKEWYPGYRV